MATDDERRRAAANLRELAPGSEWPRAVAVACGMDTARMSGNFHEYTEQLCMRLADLIEPDHVGDSNTMVDRDALLRLSDEIYDTSCDNHGELTVDLIDIWGWAQAIYEFLGVES